MKLGTRARLFSFMFIVLACMSAGCVPIGKLPQQVWIGFGRSLGGIPADIVSSVLVIPILEQLGFTQP